MRPIRGAQRSVCAVGVLLSWRRARVCAGGGAADDAVEHQTVRVC